MGKKFMIFRSLLSSNCSEEKKQKQKPKTKIMVKEMGERENDLIGMNEKCKNCSKADKK